MSSVRSGYSAELASRRLIELVISSLYDCILLQLISMSTMASQTMFFIFNDSCFSISLPVCKHSSKHTQQCRQFSPNSCTISYRKFNRNFHFRINNQPSRFRLANMRCVSLSPLPFATRYVYSLCVALIFSWW